MLGDEMRRSSLVVGSENNQQSVILKNIMSLRAAQTKISIRGGS